MESEIFFSGIGGQGVQLAAKTLALAAVAEGREVIVFGTYGGSMRGGNTDSTIVIGDGPLLTPPIVDSAGALMLMHHYSWAELRPKMRAGATILVDTSVVRGELDFDAGTIVPIDATARATALGIQRAASMLALGAFAALTKIVRLESLLSAARDVLPSYRSQHVAANETAIRAGHSLIAEGAAAAALLEGTAP
jgi:Pyruvate/2-oxoacid:ferredoxin oxidoreductase gamma subunit